MAEEKKSESKQLKEKLFASKKHGALRMSEDDQTACEALCKDYMAFLNQSKTEREACANAEALLKEHGFVPFTPGMALKAGDKVYQNNRGKAMIAAIIGSAPITEGVRLCAAHIDSPRLDMKQNPLYEDSELGLFKTHYYGGINKYQLDSFAFFGFLERHRTNQNIQFFAPNQANRRPFHLFGCQMRQQVGYTKYRVAFSFADVDGYLAAVCLDDDTMQGKRNGCQAEPAEHLV